LNIIELAIGWSTNQPARHAAHAQQGLLSAAAHTTFLKGFLLNHLALSFCLPLKQYTHVRMQTHTHTHKHPTLTWTSPPFVAEAKASLFAAADTAVQCLVVSCREPACARMCVYMCVCVCVRACVSICARAYTGARAWHKLVLMCMRVQAPVMNIKCS